MNKNLLILSLFLVSLSAVLGAAHRPCFCELVYFPVCSTDGHSYETFSNECFGDCVNFTMTYTGPCRQDVRVPNPECLSNCGKNLSWVCAILGNETLSIPNACIAECLGLDIVQNGTCDSQRVLGITSWWSGVVNKVADIVEKTEDSIKNAANKTAEAIKKAVNKTGEAIETAANKTAEAFKNVVNKTETALDNAADKIKNALNQVAQILSNRIRKVEEGFQNCTCHVVEKIGAAVENKLEEWDAKAKAEAEKLKNKTIQWWEQTRDGFISAERKVAGWFDRTAQGVANRTILIWARTRGAIKKEVDWFKRVVNCQGCSNDFRPVCIHTDDGDEATMLNECWAKCGQLQIMYQGKCLRLKDNEGEALVVENVDE